MNKTTSYRRASVSGIIRYAFGGVGSNTAYIMVMTWLTFFYTDIFGISPAMVAGLMLVTRLIDAVTDPLMGMIGDRTRSRLGRFRPYIIFGAPLLGITVFLLFSSPALSATGKIVYAYITYVTYSLISTVVNIPYHALTPVMTEDPDQRTVVTVTKQTGAIIPSLIVTSFGLPLVNAFGGGQRGWMLFAALCGVVITISFWLCAWGAKKADTMDRVTSVKRQPIKQQLKLIYRNKPLLMLLIATGTDSIAAAVTQSVNVYYFTYFLGRQDLITVVSLISLPCLLLAFSIIPFLSKKLGKKRLFVLFTTLTIIPLVILFFLPANSVVLIILISAISTFTALIPGTLGWAMLPDCVEYAEWKHGVRGDGTVSSTMTFTNKVGMAIGGALTGVLLGAFGYVAGQQQTETVLWLIRGMRFITPILGYIASIISMKFYPITNEYYANMQKDLDERRAAKTTFASAGDDAAKTD